MKTKIIAALLLVFLAGIALGLCGGAWHARHVLFRPHHGEMPSRMREHLRHELNLSDEQAEKIGPVIERTTAELERIRRETSERVAATMKRSRDEIAPLLTPDQQARLDKLEERHRRALHHLGPPPP